MGRFDCECGGNYSPYENICYHCGRTVKKYIKMFESKPSTKPFRSGIGTPISIDITFENIGYTKHVTVGSNSKLLHGFTGLLLKIKGYRKE